MAKTRGDSAPEAPSFVFMGTVRKLKAATIITLGGALFFGGALPARSQAPQSSRCLFGQAGGRRAATRDRSSARASGLATCSSTSTARTARR